MGLGRVLDDRDAAFFRDLENGLRLRRLPVQMDRHDGRGLAADGGRHFRGVHVVRIAVHVDEGGLGSAQEESRRRREERERRDEDLRARADSVGQERDVEGCSPIRHRDPVPSAHVSGECRLERFDLGTLGEHAGPKDLLDGGELLFSKDRPSDRDHRRANGFKVIKVRRSLARTGTDLSLGPEFGECLSIVGAPHLRIEGFATLADPADDLRGDAGDEGMCGDVPRDDGPGADHRVSTYPDAAENRGVSADGRPIGHLCCHDLPVRIDSSRIFVVREASVWTNKDALANPDSSVESGEVLDLAIVAHRDFHIDVDVFANSAIAPDDGTLS